MCLNAGEAHSALNAGRYLLNADLADINKRDRWDSVPLYYACLAGHADVAAALLEAGAVCNEYTFDGDRCHYAGAGPGRAGT